MADKDYFEFPKELDKKCAKEEFHKMMSFNDAEIPIEKVNFLDYPSDEDNIDDLDFDKKDYDIRELVIDKSC